MSMIDIRVKHISPLLEIDNKRNTKDAASDLIRINDGEVV